jgi:hypothetical protein
MDRFKLVVEALRQRTITGLRKANAFMQTPFGAATASGLLLLIAARLLG